MLQTLLLIAAAHAAGQCDLNQPAPNAPPELRSPALDSDHRRGFRARIESRRHERQARRPDRHIERTLAKWLRPFRHLREARRDRAPRRLFERLRSPRHRPDQDDSEQLPAPGVTVPHEDPVDLPLYPTPNQ